MNIEDQVCSLELSKRLHELGMKQESLFYWCKPKGEFYKEEHNKKFQDFAIYIYGNNFPSTDEHNNLILGGCGCCQDNEDAEEKYSAFTVAELGLFFPNTVDTKKDEPFNFFRLQITTFFSCPEMGTLINNFIVNYKCDTASQECLFDRMLCSNIYDPNLANAIAEMLIYLMENDLWKPE